MATSSGFPTDRRRSDCHSESHQPRALRTRCIGDSRECPLTGQALNLSQLPQFAEFFDPVPFAPIAPAPTYRFYERVRRPAIDETDNLVDATSAIRRTHVRKDVREFIRRLEAVGLTVEATPGHYRVLRDGKPLRKANGMPFMLPFSPDTVRWRRSAIIELRKLGIDV